MLQQNLLSSEHFRHKSTYKSLVTVINLQFITFATIDALTSQHVVRRLFTLGTTNHG